MFELKDKNLYYIGGIVRDEILGKECFDTDLTYIGHAIDYCKKKYPEYCIKINEDFGTVRLKINDKEIDIASTRDEVYDKKGHLPRVYNIGCDLKKDVLRRDFTINALAKSTLTGEIVDYTNGLKDIEDKILRVLHDNSFIDDPTRIVRGLKFAVRFGFELDKHTKKLQEDYLNNINYDMSYKRLKKELIETFDLNKQECYDRFTGQKIYKLIGKSKVNPPVCNIEDLINNYPVKTKWIVYIGWHDDIENLPLTKEEQKIINDYRELLGVGVNIGVNAGVNVKEDDYSIYKTCLRKSKEAILLYTIKTGSNNLLRYFDIENIKPEITGNDLKKAGITPSKKYSECFDYILKKKLENSAISKEDELVSAMEFFKRNGLC